MCRRYCGTLAAGRPVRRGVPPARRPTSRASRPETPDHHAQTAACRCPATSRATCAPVSHVWGPRDVMPEHPRRPCRHAWRAALTNRTRRRPRPGCRPWRGSARAPLPVHSGDPFRRPSRWPERGNARPSEPHAALEVGPSAQPWRKRRCRPHPGRRHRSPADRARRAVSPRRRRRSLASRHPPEFRRSDRTPSLQPPNPSTPMGCLTPRHASRRGFQDRQRQPPVRTPSPHRCQARQQALPRVRRMSHVPTSRMKSIDHRRAIAADGSRRPRHNVAESFPHHPRTRSNLFRGPRETNRPASCR